MSTLAKSPFKMKVQAPYQAVETIAPGDYVGAVVGLIDLGTQINSFDEKKTVHQFVLVLQLETDAEVMPLVSQQFTMSLDPKSGFRPVAESYLGRSLKVGEEFDPYDLMGKSLGVKIINDTSGDKTYHRIAKGGIGKIHRLETPIPVEKQREHFVYSVDQGEPPDMAWVPRIYGRPVNEIIMESKEFGGHKAAHGPAGGNTHNAELRSTIDRVEALLAHTTDAGCTPEEAKSFVEKAKRLMEERGIRAEHLSREAFDTLDCPF